MTDLGPRELIEHAFMLASITQLVNLTTHYLNAPEGSGEEEIAERDLSQRVSEVLGRGPDYAGSLILGLLSLLATTADPERAQEWLNEQTDQIAIALEGLGK